MILRRSAASNALTSHIISPYKILQTTKNVKENPQQVGKYWMFMTDLAETNNQNPHITPPHLPAQTCGNALAEGG
jgi:hypothetical protein